MGQIQFRPLFAYELEHISKMFGNIIAADIMTSARCEDLYRTIYINRFPLTNLSEETQEKLSNFLLKTYNLPIERILINEYIDLEIKCKTGLCTVNFDKYLFTFNEGPLLEVPFSINTEPYIRNNHIHIAKWIDQSIHFALVDSSLQQTQKAR